MEGILSIVLFGSVARGEERDDSDIDLAIYLNRPVEDPLFESRLSLELEKKVGRKFDIQIINSKTTAFIHQVLKHGKLLFSRDEKARVEFESKKTAEYLDFLPLMQQYNEKRLERYGVR